MRGPAIWLWPVAAAVLAAWPVWRSVAPETPDIGSGWLRLELVLGAGLALLYGLWVCLRRRQLRGLEFPLWVIILAGGGAIIATRRGDAQGADLCVLMIAWTASTGIFAALALIQSIESGLAAGAVAPHRVSLLPPVPGLLAANVVAMVGITYLATRLPSSAAIMGVVSPGAILAWASLADTARSTLAARRVYFAHPDFLPDLAGRRSWRLLSPAILLGDRPKLTGLYPAEGVKPGDLAALAAALTMDDDSELGRAIQEFGVSHRIRLPILKTAHGMPAQAHHATLGDGAEIALCDQAAMLEGGFELGAFEEPIMLAKSLDRDVLAVVEHRPQRRVLGVLVFAIGSRPGAAAALQSLQAQEVDVRMSAPARDTRDEPALKSLQVPRAAKAEERADESVAVIRPGQADESGAMVVRFGPASPAQAMPAAHLVVAREDPRSLADLARFAADFRSRLFIVTLLANAPGWVLIAAAFGYLPVSPLLVTGVAVVGIVVAVATPQVLRLSPTLAKEVDEE